MKKTAIAIMAFLVLGAFVWAATNDDVKVSLSFSGEDQTKVLYVAFSGDDMATSTDTPLTLNNDTIDLVLDDTTFLAKNKANSLYLWIKSIGYAGTTVTLSIDKDLSADTTADAASTGDPIAWKATVNRGENPSVVASSPNGGTAQDGIITETTTDVFTASYPVTIETTEAPSNGTKGVFTATLSVAIESN